MAELSQPIADYIDQQFNLVRNAILEGMVPMTNFPDAIATLVRLVNEEQRVHPQESWSYRVEWPFPPGEGGDKVARVRLYLANTVEFQPGYDIHAAVFRLKTGYDPGVSYPEDFPGYAGTDDDASRIRWQVDRLREKASA